MPVPPQDGDKQDDVRTGEGDKSSAASSHHKHSSMLEKTLLTLEERELEEQRNLNYSMLVDDEEAPQAGNKPPLLQRIRTRAFWADLWVRTKAEAHHYKMGFKLLWADIRISSRLLWKVLKGGTLTRRERGQFIRTSSDLFRLVPFSVFIIVPGAELLLPFAIRVFPGLLPSQFQSSKLEKRKGELKVKIEMAKFLTQTLDQMAVEKANAGSEVSEDIKSLSKFLAKVGFLPPPRCCGQYCCFLVFFFFLVFLLESVGSFLVQCPFVLFLSAAYIVQIFASLSFSFFLPPACSLLHARYFLWDTSIRTFLSRIETAAQTLPRTNYSSLPKSSTMN